ncbi:hypothetical protein MACJ_004093 [Theileria orientalis]|uniref:Transmembrane protein n=1 Tax=Theileria orientalis TaxID=68886 RepID=A0A976SL67_THEOR|nr:hypothetical protein MACJ_004093 [Theileria orientalis]
MNVTRFLSKTIPIPNFTKSRLVRRNNMAEQDRAIFYYSNLFCIVVTALPVAYLFKANYWNSKDQMHMDHVLGHLSTELTEFSDKKIKY